MVVRRCRPYIALFLGKYYQQIYKENIFIIFILSKEGFLTRNYKLLEILIYKRYKRCEYMVVD